MRSSSSKRWLRACVKLVITTSSGERSIRSDGPDRHVEHEHPVDRARERVRQRDVVDDAAVDETAAVVVDDREHAGQRGAREQRGLERTAREHHLFAGVEVGRDHPERDLEVSERAGRRACAG